MPAGTGADTRITYLHEDNGFASSPSDTTYKTFGHSVTLDDASFSNDPVNMLEPATREAAERVARAFDGTWGVSFTLANPWWWEHVIADESSSGSSPTTHTYDGETPESLRLIVGDEVNSEERLLKGCVVSDCTVEVSDNGEVNVTLSGAYADEENQAISQSQVSETFEPLLFHDGSLTVDGTTYQLVQSGSVTISNNIDMVPALGQRTPADYSPKLRSTTVDWSQIVNTTDAQTAYEQTLGTSSSPATRLDGDDEVDGSLVFDNGESGSAQNKQTIKFNTSAFPDEYGRSGQGDPTADYIEEQTLTVRQVSVEAVNASASAD